MEQHRARDSSDQQNSRLRNGARMSTIVFNIHVGSGSYSAEVLLKNQTQSNQASMDFASTNIHCVVQHLNHHLYTEVVQTVLVYRC